MVFCNRESGFDWDKPFIVTILILIDGFLQSYIKSIWYKGKNSHNPYFNRWFSAISNYIKDVEGVI